MLSDELLDEVFLALGGEQDRLGLEEGVVGPPILGALLSAAHGGWWLMNPQP